MYANSKIKLKRITEITRKISDWCFFCKENLPFQPKIKLWDHGLPSKSFVYMLAFLDMGYVTA
jgi:hypothetical protein